MQLHAVRGRAVALICGRPNSKNSRLGFELLPFSTRREGPRRPLVTRREEWNANSSPRLNKTGSEAGASLACIVSARATQTMSGLLRAARYTYCVIEPSLRVLGPAAPSPQRNQPSCINPINRRGAPAPRARIHYRHRGRPAPGPKHFLHRPAPAGSPRRASSRPRAPGPPRRASPPRGRSRRSPRSSRCARTASSCRSWSRPWSGSSTRRRRSISSRSRPSSWRSPASSRPRRGRGLPFALRPVLFITHRAHPARLARVSLAQHRMCGRLRDDTRRRDCATRYHS